MKDVPHKAPLFPMSRAESRAVPFADQRLKAITVLPKSHGTSSIVPALAKNARTGHPPVLVVLGEIKRLSQAPREFTIDF
jgi:hypothetical protein